MNFPGIKFWNVNTNNTAIAQSVSGAGAATDQIFRPDSSELSFSGTIALTASSPTVTGTGTAFTTQVQVGQLLFAYVGSDPVLIGEVLTITNNTSLVLKSDGPSPVTGSGLDYGATNKLFRTGQGFYISVPVIVAGINYTVPSIRLLRQGNTDNDGIATLVSLLSFDQYSESGIPNVEGSIVNVPLLLTRTNAIPSVGSDGSGTPVSYSAPPTNFWYYCNPFVSTNPSLDLLLAQTTFRIFLETDLPSFTIINNSTLLSLGDSNTAGNTGGQF